MTYFFVGVFGGGLFYLAGDRCFYLANDFSICLGALSIEGVKLRAVIETQQWRFGEYPPTVTVV